MSEFKKIKAEFFWLGGGYCAKYHHGAIIKIVPSDTILKEEEIDELGTYWCKSTKFIRRTLMKKCSLHRYITIFRISDYLHLYYEDQIGDRIILV